MDIVHEMDKKGTIQCPNEGNPTKTEWGQIVSDHGKMVVHGSGAYQICGICGTKAPTGASL